MHGVTYRRWRAQRDDRGAASTLVAALLAIGLLLGIGALVIDTGQLYAERAELQNGADAGALALAQDCADADGCGTDVDGTATRYAGANAGDGVAGAQLVCGLGGDLGGGLRPCPADEQSPAVCLGDRPATGNFVEVRTRTELPDGSGVLPPTFGRVLLGNSYDGRGVLACARAAWGGPRVASALGLTMSLCEWQIATSGGTDFAPSPPEQPDPSDERVLAIHGTGIACAGGASGWDLPGGFGWLEDQSGNCDARIDITGIYRDTTGVPASQECKARLQQAIADNEPVLVPVFDGAGGSGHNGYYHLRGFASFVITGYSLPGFRQESTLTGRHLCGVSEKCVYGYFTRDLISADDAVLGGPDMGATTVQVIG